MSENFTIKDLAELRGISPLTLLQMLKAAGLSFDSVDQSISHSQKESIDAFLEQQTQDASSDKESSRTTLHLKSNRPNRIVLKRSTKSTLQTAGSQSRSPKTVNVEVRKKRTYVKRSLLEEHEKSKEKMISPVITSEEDVQDISKSSVAPQIFETSEVPIERQVEKDSLEKTVVPSAEKLLGIDQKIVLENIEREKRHVKEREKEQGKPKKKIKDRQNEKAYQHKKVDLRCLDLEEDDELNPIKSVLSSSVKEVKTQKKTAIDPSTISIQRQSFERPVAPITREISIPESISVSDLAQKMAVKATEVIKVLMSLGVIATIYQNIDQDTAVLVVESMGHRVKILSDKEIEDSLLKEAFEGEEGKMFPRAPIVTIMGHVDHGKTKLLDCIRSTKVAEGEAGGITQHIGAYHVNTDRGMITFLDTPGHEAFTAMRARGAKLTDIVVLVVAADDGVMPQTIEAIQHAQAAHVPIVVAINKIDKPEADPERVKSELAQYDVIPEEWGGSNLFVNISAKNTLGIDELLEAILLQAEMLELKAIKDAPARGLVIESRLNAKRGALATVLVQKGTLHVSNIVLSGLYFGRIRTMNDEFGNKIQEAGPSIPVEISGLSGTPLAGEPFVVVQSEKKAKEIIAFRRSQLKKTGEPESSIKLDQLFDQIEKKRVSTLKVILKADGQGSLEALRESLLKLSTSEVQIKIISSGIGGITESDVNLAIASEAIIIGFNVRADLPAKLLIEKTGVDVRYYSIIYQAIEEIKAALSGLLTPEIKEKTIGLAKVREVFHSSRFGVVAGCMVVEGVIKRNRPVRVLRDHIVIFEGEIDSLRRFKEDVNEVRQNTECGIGIKNYQDIKVGDQIEVFERVQVQRTL